MEILQGILCAIFWIWKSRPYSRCLWALAGAGLRQEKGKRNPGFEQPEFRVVRGDCSRAFPEAGWHLSKVTAFRLWSLQGSMGSVLIGDEISKLPEETATRAFLAQLSVLWWRFEIA